MIEGENIEPTEISEPESGQKSRILIIGIAMLLVGLILGYLGRGAFGPEAISARKTETAAAAAVQTQVSSNQEMMKSIVAETIHFKGDPAAPITMIEFSDFQ